MNRRWLVLALLFTFPAFTRAEEPKKVEAKKEPMIELKPGKVPFRLTDTNHTLVRVKINGKGPFNFVVDTGCPVFLIAEPVAEKIGLKKGWVTLDKLELEGGLKMTKLKARVETPFQIEGMNGMGLAGVELHGLMGYTVLAKYKMEFDFTKKEMIWTPVKTEPLEPMPLGKKGAKDVAGGGMDMMIAMVKILTWASGITPPPPPQPRGFFGFELEQKDKTVVVARVLADGPAAKAGLKKGDRIVRVNDTEISEVAEVLRHASKITAGRTLTLTIERDQKEQELKITAGDGL
jgi:serine protease DegQ